MPNWTSSTIHISSDPADIRAFLETVKWEDQIFDFNRIIPIPDILRHTSSGHRVFDGVSVRSWFIENPDANSQDQIERPFTDEEEAQLAAIGYRDWYAWSWDHWGTKWNACRAELTEPHAIDHGYTVIRFDTAWAPPLPVFHRMFAMFPQLSFSCSWQNEDEPELTHSLEREALVEGSVDEE